MLISSPTTSESRSLVSSTVFETFRLTRTDLKWDGTSKSSYKLVLRIYKLQALGLLKKQCQRNDPDFVLQWGKIETRIIIGSQYGPRIEHA